MHARIEILLYSSFWSMHITLQEPLTKELEAARQMLSHIAHDWSAFLHDYEKAIMEVNALQDESKRHVVESMQKVVLAYLPDSNAPELVGSLLRFDTHVYDEMVKKFSAGWIAQASHTAIHTHLERYEEEMDVFVRTFLLSGNIGNYFIGLTKLALQFGTTSPTEFSHQSIGDCEGFVKARATDMVESVERDTVGLESFAREQVAPQYRSLLVMFFGKDVEMEYVRLSEEYYGMQHAPMLVKLASVLQHLH